MSTRAAMSDTVKHWSPQEHERRLAMTAEWLYLANLTVLPVIALVVLAILWRKHNAPHSLAANHIEQALFTPLWAALVIAAMCVSVLLTGEDTALSWSILLPTLALLHGVLILLGGFGLTRAMTGLSWRYPILGPDIEYPQQNESEQRRSSWKK